MSYCVPCRTETVYENRKAATHAAQKEADCQKQLEAALKKVAELEAQIAEAHKNPCCPLFKIESITSVGKEVLVTFDNCTYTKAPMDVVDESLSKAKTDADSAKVEELSKALEALKTKVDEVAAKEDKDTVFDPSALETRVAALEAKDTSSTDLSALEARVTALEGKEDKDTIFDPESLIGRISALENKEDKDTVYDDTAIRNLITALQNKEDKDTVFDPSTLEARITALESKEDKDTVYDDSALAARVKALEDTPAGDKVDTTAFVRKDELVDVQNFAGTVRFKAYPAPNVTPAEDHLN
jgi:hypothetical protein|nr:MAG TPA: hypothetical protein [Caudoviricetes sp.]